MEDKIIVKLNNIPQSPQKLRLVADLVRGKDAQSSIEMLALVNKKGARFVSKAIKSGISNAVNNKSWTNGDLVISEIKVDVATTYKRGRFASRGRSSRILKRRANLSLELSRKA
ncbi:50S ribosomal protein L22 [Candidatus Dojkabacteria bacterium]|uniref:50S ribosomal protein L22 n=1 Tax=Candidatus Dojkabacteria bacterium TaxID=2099670 RepID=A0A955HY89_9BACT|nr:50S ribosomal protein L22 [Candidatus Dojkabacteria bacterium]MCB9790804.1 50S ribosomal protein L22 [Candidatus Nomurabacteria bacterium]